jgi:hypothetical protein
VQNLDRHLAPVLEILRPEDGGHAAAADLRLDGVPVRKSRLKASEEVGHVSAP